MTDDQLIEQTKKLIAVRSTGDNTPALQEAYELVKQFVLEQTKSKNVTVEEFESNSILSFLAYRGTSRPAKLDIVLNGHLDVIAGKPEQYNATIKNGKLYGRGTHDMKAACVVMADVFCELVDKVPYALGLQIVTDEEIGGDNGTLYQIQQGVRADFVICGECGRATNVYEIANGTKAVIFAEVEFGGKTAHGGYPWRGDNAAMKAAHFAKFIHERFPTPANESHDTTVTLTALVSEAGVHNKIPEHAFAKLDIRVARGDDRFKDQETATAFFKSIDPTIENITYPAFSTPMYADPNSVFMQELKRAAESVEGEKFKFVTRHAGSDGRHFVKVDGQACEFGIAGEDQHGDNEHITLKAFSHYRNTLRLFLEKITKTETAAAISYKN